MAWLITGGAGYIGAHVVDVFSQMNEEIIVLDNLSTGYAERIVGKGPLITADICNLEEVEAIFNNFTIEGVIHLAALKSVEQSNLYPQEYFKVNVEGTRNLLSISIQNEVEVFILSSSAAVYGNSKIGIVNESTKLKPISNYGLTKMKSEELLDKAIDQKKIRGTSLRYFNVVGAKNEMLRDRSNANLFPIIREKIQKGLRPEIFGGDYPTEDGSCVRDYVHVCDIARAHFEAAKILKNHQINKHLNIGTGRGYSVKEIIKEFEIQYKIDLNPIIQPRRIGDPAELVADTNLAFEDLGFQAKMTLREMVKSSY